jgi:hypothetical protein
MSRLILNSICLGLASLAAAEKELLTDFRPSTVSSEYGAVSEIKFSTPVIELESGVLAHHLPQAIRNFRITEPVWIIGYRTEILDSQGRPPRENYLCHTFFGDQRVTQHQDQELKGIYSDAFTPEVRLPDGFGIRLTPDESLNWMPMFNNRDQQPTRVAMNTVLLVIRDKDVKKPLTPLYSTLRSVAVPHLFFVPPGRHEKSTTFESPFDGKIHFLGTHIHPHGVSIELFNVSRREQVWKGSRRLDNKGRMVGMEVYSSAEGYPVRAGEAYRVTAVYDNPTRAPIDAMAGLFMVYSRR